MTARLTDFFRHNLWANERLLDACAPLTDEQLDFTTTLPHQMLLTHLWVATVYLVASGKRWFTFSARKKAMLDTLTSRAKRPAHCSER